ncbi:BTB domain containing protein [Pandoravirus salinus]|uniref:BTB domain containing protein n=1 Tax=Pandoravirus salinus TaxID=1349410 RepID=S4VYU0_9VIRU|nr:BTB domain [Pandoravirus salinus]AGO84646.1 BTB domain containing protein [Pandoravirus salinus]
MTQWAERVLATMRHQHCDCLLEVRLCGTDESAAPTRIAAHRAILARAAYFGALFRHVEPDRVDRRDADGSRICRSAYLLEMSFDPAALAFVVECLYDDDRVERVVECGDPVDVIHAALFVEAPRHHIRRLVRFVLHALLVAIAAQTRDGGTSDARAQLTSFVWHMLASGLEPIVKTRLLGRVLGLLGEADREAILAQHGDLVPEHFYQPPSRVGEAVTDDSGRRWRTIHLAFDSIEFVGGEKRVEWDGLVFSGFEGMTSHGDGIHVTIDRLARARAVPVRPRAVVIEAAHAYGPLDSASVGLFSAVPTGQQEGAGAVVHPFIRQGSASASDGAIGSATITHQAARVVRPGRSPVSGDLEAYEIILLVEEPEQQRIAP